MIAFEGIQMWIRHEKNEKGEKIWDIFYRLKLPINYKEISHLDIQPPQKKIK